MVGKSAARAAKTKQNEDHSVDKTNDFQSLMDNQRNEEASNSQPSSQGDQGYLHYSYFIPV